MVWLWGFTQGLPVPVAAVLESSTPAASPCDFFPQHITLWDAHLYFSSNWNEWCNTNLTFLFIIFVLVYFHFVNCNVPFLSPISIFFLFKIICQLQWFRFVSMFLVLVFNCQYMFIAKMRTLIEMEIFRYMHVAQIHCDQPWQNKRMSFPWQMTMHCLQTRSSVHMVILTIFCLDSLIDPPMKTKKLL